MADENNNIEQEFEEEIIINKDALDKPKEKKSLFKKEEKEVKSKKRGFSQILAFAAYIGIGCIAIALLLTLAFKNNTKLSDTFTAIGQVIAYIICIILAFSWVKTHKKIAWIVCYVIFVVTIVVLFILTINNV